MYGIFELDGRGQRLKAFNGDVFASREVAIAAIPSVFVADMDDENDAADVATKGGMVYAIERVA